MDILKWTERQRKYLENEKEAEKEEAVNSKQAKIVVVIEVIAGLKGRSDVKLAFKGGSQSLQFRTGESVQIRTSETKEEKQGQPVSGIVTLVTEKEITVSLDEFEEDWYEKKLLLYKVTNEVTFQRMDKALKMLDEYEKQAPHASKIVQLCFSSNYKPKFVDLKEKLIFYDENLNDIQKEAIEFTLSSDDVSLILGPPGK